MTQEYKIVVIDDQPNNIRAALQQIKTSIDLDGFESQHITCNSRESLAQLITRSDLASNVDLVIVDKNLGLIDENGAKVIKRLRAKLPHVPVLFYSGDSAQTLRTLIAAESIDGVYCCHRRDLKAECVSIFRAQARAQLQPQAMRGFVISEASELDHVLRDAVIHIKDYLAESGLQQLRKIVASEIGRTRQSIDEFLKAIESSTDIEFILDGQKVSSIQLLNILLALLDSSIEERHASGFIEVLQEYINEVIQPRNIFAHGRKSTCGTQISLGNRIIKLDSPTARQHREALKRHHNNLNSLIDHLKETLKSAPVQGSAQAAEVIAEVIDKAEEAAAATAVAIDKVGDQAAKSAT